MAGFWYAIKQLKVSSANAQLQGGPQKTSYKCGEIEKPPTSIAARGGGGSFKRLKLYKSKEHVPIESFVTTLID